MDMAIVAPSVLAPFVLTSLLIELTPGPNMTYLAVVAASEGRRAGFATVAGVALGLAAVGLLAALGVAELIQASEAAYQGLRWAGVAFLLYLAWDGWRQGLDVVGTERGSHGRYFVRGLVTNLLNPKAAVFYVAVLPTFVDPTTPARGQTLLLTATYVAAATLVHAMIVALAGTLQPLLTDPDRERLARRIMSGLLACVAVWFAWET